MKNSFLLTFALLFLGFSLHSQVIITLDENTTYDETLVFTENTIIQGIGNPTIIFNGSPKMEIKNCRVLLKNVSVQEEHDMGKIIGEDAVLEWFTPQFTGAMHDGLIVHENFLDGTPKK